MRFLHGRNDHDGGQPHRGGSPGSAAGLEGQPVSLYRVPRDRGRDPRDQNHRGRPTWRGVRSEPARPRERGDRHGEGALHPRYRSRGPAAFEAAQVAARPRPHRRHPQRGRFGDAGRPRGLHLGGRAPAPVYHRHPRRPPRRSRRYLHAGQRRAVRRAAGGGRGGPTARPPRKKAAAASRSTTRCSRRSSTPRKRCRSEHR